jgi:hypothetical protein
MKNQYFGDVNDYCKYGLLRLLAGDGSLRTGVCWMLTQDDNGPDGKKTEYLKDDQLNLFRHFDPDLYDFLRGKIHEHETERVSRDVKNFTDRQLKNAKFHGESLSDARENREAYFRRMWSQFATSQVDLIFFDPDNGLANNNNSKSPKMKGTMNSSKNLFRDEVSESLNKGFSVLFYQHFDRTSRSDLVARLGSELAAMTPIQKSYSFWTPHVVFFLVPLEKHMEMISNAIVRVLASRWAQPRSCRTSLKNDQRHILVGMHNI